MLDAPSSVELLNEVESLLDWLKITSSSEGLDALGEIWSLAEEETETELANKKRRRVIRAFILISSCNVETMLYAFVLYKALARFLSVEQHLTKDLR